MSLRERLLIASSLVVGLSAMGCGDGDDTNVDDSGTTHMDGGRADGGKVDAGKEASVDAGDEDELPTMACGSNTCTSNIVNERVVTPCCVLGSDAKPTDQCGFDAEALRRANPSSPFTGCIPRDVPAASASTYCGAFWDQVEIDGEQNGGLDIKSGSVRLVFDGCCLPTGECGAKIDTPQGADPSAINTHLGCVSFGRLQVALNPDGGTMEQPKKLPYCVPSTGAPLGVKAEVPNQPKFVCGCGDGKVDDHMGTFPCFNSLATDSCGARDATAAELAMIPEFICGCDADPTKNKLPCMVNTATTVCGTKQIDKDSAELAKIPSFICGEDPTSAVPTLKGVDKSVCGKKTPDDMDLAGVPEFICGETGNPPTNPLPKLRNLPATTCGKLDIMAGNPYLAAIPEFICGQDPAVEPSLPVMPNVDKAVCGTKQIDGTSAELGLIPEFICGREGLTAVPKLPVLPGVAMDVCGKKEITADSAELAKVPEFICGATGATPQTAGLPHLANVEAAVCGKKVIDTDSAELAEVPVFVCGAEGGTFVGLPQLPNVPVAACGKKAITQDSVELDSIPQFICGLVGTTDTSALPKLTGVAATICGKEVVAAGSPRLAGVPKFMCGCNSNPAIELGCMRNVDTAVCGALTPTTAILANVPEFICGCGDTTRDPVVGVGVCMSFVAQGTCGTKDIAVSTRAALGGMACLVGVPEYAFGCGDNASPTPTNPCLRNAGTTPNTFGCDDVNPAVPASVYGLRRQPEYLCGCGPTNAYTGPTDTDGPFPCLSFVDKAICGTVAIPVVQAIQQRFPTLPATYCGCGDPSVSGSPQANTNPASLPCIPNVSREWCAPGAIPNDPTGGGVGCTPGYPVGNIPGCGASTPAPSYPIQCLPNTAAPSCTP